MHKSKVEAVYRLLGCNNSDIARALKCSPSDISRVRTGSRTYKPTSRPVMRFAEGIYLYADKSGTLSSLCKLCGIKIGSCEEVVPKLIGWLFDTDEAALPDFSYIEERARSIKKQKSLFFGERLSCVMELTSVSNIRLAKSISMDVSAISRFRSGLRKPKPPTDILLASVLYDRAEKQGKLTELSSLCGLKEGCANLNAFFDWLYDDSSVDIIGIDKLLDSIERFSLQENKALPEPSSLVPADIVNTDKTAYIGIDGLREAVMRFLFDATESGGELYLYSNQDMGWMVSDFEFRMKWLALMSACIKAGVKIRIIHNIDRGSEEMLDAIQSWMPLYITGLIEPYVCNLGSDDRFAKTIFIRKNRACIVASVLRGKEDMGYYEYVTDPERIRIHTAEFETLLSSSSKLLNIYFHDYTPIVNNQDAVKALLPQLSLGSLPQEILQQIIDKADLTKNEREDIFNAYREKKAYLDKLLMESNKISELVCLPSDEELFAGQVRLSIPKAICNRDLFYTPEEYGAHIAAIMKLMEKHNNYELILLPELPFSQLQIIATQSSIAVTRTGELHAAFVFSEPRLLRSFAEYFSLLEEQYHTDKATVKQTLLRFL